MPNAIRRALSALLLYALSLLPGAPAEAGACLVCSCSVSVSPLAFGIYTPASQTALQMSGSSTISCTTTVALSVTVILSLSPGSGTFAQRTMLGPGGATLNYNVYTNAGYSVVFGDGTVSTATESVTFPLALLGTTRMTMPYYASIPAGGNAIPGNYSDSPLLTINY